MAEAAAVEAMTVLNEVIAAQGEVATLEDAVTAGENVEVEVVELDTEEMPTRK